MQCDAWDGSSRLQFVPVTVNSVVPFFLASGSSQLAQHGARDFFLLQHRLSPTSIYMYFHGLYLSQY